MKADVNGIRMHYEVSGEGEPVLLVGGFGANARFWNHAVGLLDGFMTVTFDNRGVGETEYSGGFTVEDMADDAVALMDHLGIDRAHVLGWSMGSHIAQAMALGHGDRLKSLTLVSTYGRRPARSEYVLRGFTRMALEGRAPIECLAMVVNAFCFTEETFRGFEERGCVMPVPKRLESPEGLTDQLDAVSAYVSGPEVSGIKVPTMVVHGGRDIMVEPSEGMAVASRIPGSRFLLLESAGHNIPPELYFQDFKQFMASCR